jgi:uncharacterized repeat protein (TIGR01451 family)
MARRGSFQRTQRGQSLAEMALVLPIVLFLVLGVFELGRIVFIFSAVNNASREAARYGASTGGTTGGVPRYLNCDEVRQAARDTAFLSGLVDADIQIAYDEPDTANGIMQVYGNCVGSTARSTATGAVLTGSDVQQGDRIVVTVQRQINPILPFFPSFAPTFVTARTILKEIAIGPPECSDGVDNDGDGFIDYPDDPGCESPDDPIEALCHRLSVVARPEDAGTMSRSPGPNCSNLFVQGTGVNLEAFKDINRESYFDSRYTFHYWEGPVDSGDGSSDNPTTVTMDADKNITAHFRLLEADLSVTKTASSPDVDTEGNFLSRADLLYAITVNNTSAYNDTARNLVITDTLPSEVVFQSASTGCDSSGAPIIRCELSSLAPNASATFTIAVEAPDVSYPDVMPLSNVVTVSGFEFDPDEMNNTYTETITVIPAADLWVSEKSATPAAVEAGEVFTYSITVGNGGPSIATDVTVTDVLPAQVSFVAPGDGSCSAPVGVPGATVTCALGDMGSGDVATVTFTVVAEGGMDELAENQAVASANEYDRNPDNNNSSNDDGYVETPVYSADVAIRKRPDSASWRRDLSYAYLLDVKNNGPSIAPSVVVTDQLPAGLAYNGYSISPSIAGATCSGPDTERLITCQLGDLAPSTSSGYDYTIRIFVTPTVDTGGEFLLNTAGIQSGRLDWNPDNNQDQGSVTVAAVVGLSIDKTGPTSINHGDTLTYNITAANASGSSTAYNLHVTDTLPGGNFTYVGPANATGWSCTPPASGQVVCDRNDPLLAGQTDSFDIVIIPQEPGDFVNSARVTSDEDLTGVSNSHTTTVLPVVDLWITKTASATSVSEGDSFGYAISVGNDGISNATNVAIVDTLPAGISFVSYSSRDGWICDSTALPTITCTPGDGLGLLPAGSSASVTINVRADDDGTVTNTATLNTAEGNVSDSALPVTVDPAIDLAITATAPQTATISSPFSFTLRVTNNGPGDAHDIVVTDDLSLPAGSLVTFDAPGWTCRYDTSTSSAACGIALLAPNDFADITVTIDPGATGDVSGNASVTSAEQAYETTIGNNSATHLTTVES